ncbi:MAG TPA: transporter [Gammaproteobacteria bacterium]|nr:transporter [Gammaproteobacteria bacterium]
MSTPLPSTTTPASSRLRLAGLDLARFLALVGMVIVNFRLVMGVEETETTLGYAAGLLEGRAVAVFLILAGMGLGLSYARNSGARFVVSTVKRAVFLFVLGMLNMLVFDADILHYYGLFFLLSLLLLGLSTERLALLIGVIVGVSIVMLFALDYDQGWDWKTYVYDDFWTVVGFVRHTFFNGWHPVFPWMAFLLYGVMLSRVSLGARRTQVLMIVGGIVATVVAEMLSGWLAPLLGVSDPELSLVAETDPVPPAPLYLLAASGIATALIGLCLLLAPVLKPTGVLRWINPAGRQTLTLYIVHIYIGMGALEALGMFSGQSMGSVMAASLLFTVCACLYATAWSRYAKHGPIEMVMRRCAG